MTETSPNKPPIWFWMVSLLALIWNAMGVMQYLIYTFDNASFNAQCTPEQLKAYTDLPGWYTVLFALAVFGGTIGCLGLIFRRKWSYTLLLISLISVIFQMSYITFSLKVADAMTPIIIMVSLGLVLLYKRAYKKGWIV